MKTSDVALACLSDEHMLKAARVGRTVFNIYHQYQLNMFIIAILCYELMSLSNTVCSKPRPMPRCSVLPPGEFNVMILEPLPVYSESLSMLAVTVKLKWVVVM